MCEKSAVTVNAISSDDFESLRHRDSVVYVDVNDVCQVLRDLAATEETDSRNRIHQLVKNFDEMQKTVIERRGNPSVTIPPTTTRYKDMIKTAEDYFAALKTAQDLDSNELIRQLVDLLDSLIEPYSDDPAFVAFLRSEKMGRSEQLTENN